MKRSLRSSLWILLFGLLACGDPAPGAAPEPEPEPEVGPPPQMVITEMLIDRDGPDEGNQWIELENQGADPAVLEGLNIETDASRVTLETDVVVAPGARVIVASSRRALDADVPRDLVVSAPGLSFARDRDSILIRSVDGTLVDRVDFADTTGWLIARELSMTLQPGSDGSANDMAGNWCLDESTPGVENAVCPEESPRFAAPGDLVVTEMMRTPGEEMPEWVEIVNTASAPILLDRLLLRDAAGEAEVDAAGRTLARGEYLVLREAGFDVDMDGQVIEYDGFRLSGNEDEFTIHVGDVEIDRVEWLEGSAWPDMEGEALGLDPRRSDTRANDVGLNWCLGGDGSPGAANAECEALDDTGLPTAGDLVFSEFLASPADDAPGGEWVEVHNVSTRAVRLSGLRLSVEDEYIDFPTDAPVLPAGERLFVTDREELIDLVGGFGMHFPELSLPSDEGEMELEVDGETIAELSYERADGWPLVDGIATSLSRGAMVATEMLSWCSASEDSELPGTHRGTPGAPNTECPAILDRFPATGDLVISEMMINAPGSDGGGEWIEIRSLSDMDLSLHGMTISTEDDEHTIAMPSLTLPARGYVVLRNRASDELSPTGTYHYDDALTLSNGDDVVTLALGDEVLDAVAYDRDADWPFRGGWSMTLSDGSDSVSNDDPFAWCLSWTQIDEDWNHRGTPGMPNDACAEEGVGLAERGEFYTLDTASVVRLDVRLDPDELALLNTVSDHASDPGAFGAMFSADEGDTRAATIEVRGATSRLASQKSWKIRLLEGEWQHQQTLNLNKHPFDLTRMRNALAFDLLQSVPGVTSLRTQFVNLYINGEDYGLFTQVEEYGSRMLRNHGLDERGTLMKANLFTFAAPTDEERAVGALSGLELESGSDMAGLITALDALNDGANAIDDVIAAHFDRENLLSFYASLYLMDSVDSTTQNFALYASADEPERWYMMPWDYDGAFDWYQQGTTLPRERWRHGLSNWWNVSLFQRFVQEPGNLEDLVARILELSGAALSDDAVTSRTVFFESFMGEFLSRAPDNNVGNLPRGERSEEVARMFDVTGRRAVEIVDTVERPMPVFQSTTALGGGDWQVRWTESMDLQGDALSTTVVISGVDCAIDRGACMLDENIIRRFEGLPGTSVVLRAADLDGIEPGSYYINARPTDSGGNWNSPFSQFWAPQVTVDP